MMSRLLLLAGCLLLPSVVSAQDATTPEFRPGQWALQFGGNLNLATFGVLRFSGPRSAWMLNLGVAGEFLNGTITDPGGSGDADDHFLMLQAAIGRRFYQGVNSKVRSFQSLGVTGGYLNQKLDFGVGSTTRNKSWFSGLQGEVGGAFWLSSNISLGGTASASATYVHRKTTQTFSSSELKQQGFAISGVNVALALGIYF